MTHLITFFLTVLLVTQVTSLERISVPHDIHPGYSIKQLHSKGHNINLIESNASPYFTLLDGSLIPTTKLSHLINSPVSLFIEEECDGEKIVKPIIIHVRERSKMMKFSNVAYTGNINENEDPGTIVENLSNLRVLNSVGNVSYVLSGSNDFAVHQENDAVFIVSTKVLDREVKNLYVLHLNATDSEGCVASAVIKIIVDDINDNPPVFTKKYYSWNIKSDFPTYSTVGIVKAIDADGEKPVYKFVHSNYNTSFVIVPQTGEIILMSIPEHKIYNYFVQACDNRIDSMYSDIIPVTINVGGSDVSDDHNKVLKRRKRAIRQTRTYEHFLESDGSIPGKVMFRLESVHPDEIFSLENESRWIDVDHNGDVKVREPWDYEQLEREKTIDFWVQIRAPQQPGEYILLKLLLV